MSEDPGVASLILNGHGQAAGAARDDRGDRAFEATENALHGFAEIGRAHRPRLGHDVFSEQRDAGGRRPYLEVAVGISERPIHLHHPTGDHVRRRLWQSDIDAGGLILDRERRFAQDPPR